MSWLELLQREVARSSRQKVANQLGVSRTTVSLVMAGKYGAATDAIAQRVLNTFGHIDCPVVGQIFTQAMRDVSRPHSTFKQPRCHAAFPHLPKLRAQH